MTPRDPYDDDYAVEPVGQRKRKLSDDGGGDSPKVEDGIDLFLAFQPRNDYGNDMRLVASIRVGVHINAEPVVSSSPW